MRGRVFLFSDCHTAELRSTQRHDEEEQLRRTRQAAALRSLRRWAGWPSPVSYDAGAGELPVPAVNNLGGRRSGHRRGERQHLQYQPDLAERLAELAVVQHRRRQHGQFPAAVGNFGRAQSHFPGRPGADPRRAQRQRRSLSSQPERHRVRRDCAGERARTDRLEPQHHAGRGDSTVSRSAAEMASRRSRRRSMQKAIPWPAIFAWPAARVSPRLRAAASSCSRPMSRTKAASRLRMGRQLWRRATRSI